MIIINSVNIYSDVVECRRNDDELLLCSMCRADRSIAADGADWDAILDDINGAINDDHMNGITSIHYWYQSMHHNHDNTYDTIAVKLSKRCKQRMSLQLDMASDCAAMIQPF